MYSMNWLQSERYMNYISPMRREKSNLLATLLLPDETGLPMEQIQQYLVNR